MIDFLKDIFIINDYDFNSILKTIFLYNEKSPLLFTGLYFWLFFAFVLFGYSFIYNKSKVRSFYLFFISLFFYYKSSGFFFFILIFSTLIDFFLGKSIYLSSKKWVKKSLVAFSVVLNLGLLFYFKYAYFFVENMNSFFGTQLKVFNHFAFWANEAAGAQHFEVSQILLPVGISFFTFQTISYSVDIYRGKIKPVNSIFDFGFYVSFFPQLVAGPIVRASEFIPQIHQPYNISKKEFSTALFFILNGLVKKLLVADYIAVNFIDRVFSNPQVYTGFENLMALVAYSLQIYCDFSGYTDIAIGIALLMGFRLNMNFNSPYKAKSVGEFWRRWHISFSTWLKDYLYIPLGGNRHGKFRTNVNLMITMLLGGFWHGASWQFVIWGALNGVGLIFYKFWRKISPYENSNLWIVNVWKIFITFSFITFTRIWFRADSMETANMVIHRIANYFHPELMLEMIVSYKNVFAIMLFGYIMHWLPSKFKEFYISLFDRSPIYLKAAYTVIIIIIVYQSISSDLQPFVYFQF